MYEFSETFQAALILHNAQKAVVMRSDGAWWVLDKAKWDLIASLPVGPEHAFILGLIHAYSQRRIAA